MKQECPTSLKTIGKSKALTSTLSDIEPEDESDDNDDEGILNAFIATMNPTEGIIFPSAIMRILCHFSILIPDSPYYTIMGVINAAFVRRNEAQLQPKRPSTSALSSSDGGITLEAIMV